MLLGERKEWKEVIRMRLSLSDKERIEMQFDHYCKVVMVNEMKNIKKHNSFLLCNEKMFSELSQEEYNELCSVDKYHILTDVISAAGFLLEIDNELLFEAINRLSEQKQKIIMLKYWLGMNDKEISNELKIMRRTVCYMRKNSLKQLREYLENKYSESSE